MAQVTFLPAESVVSEHKGVSNAEFSASALEVSGHLEDSRGTLFNISCTHGSLLAVLANETSSSAVGVVHAEMLISTPNRKKTKVAFMPVYYPS